jgi:sugar phosphate isomerase/epimerase
MNSAWDRRRFLQVTGCAALGLGVSGWARSGEPAKQLANGAPHAEKLGWRLGCQAYSFNRFTFFEALAKNQSLGLRYIEAYPGQSLSVEKKDVKVGEEMSAEARSDVKKQLADTGIKLVNYGVCGLSKDESASRRTFDFAADMGIETIVSEPPFDAFDTIEKLCDEYKINVAIHNHPSPSPYWNPDKVLEVCKGRTKRIGACADTGHWMRSELNPVEQVKKLEGRLISFHFKDLNKFGGEAHDVPWGTGQADAKAILAEVYRQKVRAVFSIEYEHNWTTSLPEIAQCVEFFDRAGKIFGG